MSDAVQKSVRGAMWLGVAHVLLAASGYYVAIVLARALGPAEYGKYGLIYSLLMATELLVQFGIPVAVSRLIAERSTEERRLSGTGLVLVLGLYGVIFAIVWIAAPAIARSFHIPESAWLVRVAALDLPVYGAYLFLDSVLGGRRDFLGKSVALTAYGMAKVIGVSALALSHVTTQGALLVNVLASVVGFSIALARVGRVPLQPQLAAARSIFWLAAPTALIDAGTQILSNIDLWCLSLLAGAGDLRTQGYYVAAKNLARIPTMISLVLNAVLIPSLAHAVVSGNRSDVTKYIHGTTRFIAVTLVPGCALIAMESPGLMALMFSQDYASAGPYLSLLIVGTGLFYTTFSIFLAILLANGKQGAAATLAACSVAPAFVANGVLIPEYGAIGAACAAAISGLIAMVAAGWVVRSYLGALLQLRLIPRVLLATACVCALAAVIHTNGILLVIELAMLMLVFFALGVPLGLVGKSDLALLRRSAS